MIRPYDIYYPPVRDFIDICTCGHTPKSHTPGTCEGSLGTCNCNKIYPFLRVTNAQSFCRPHVSTGEGHALIQGVINHPEGFSGIDLSHSSLGKNPECYRCRKYTSKLMPVLVNRHSMKAVKEVSRGRMTRLWCQGCCELEEVEFVADVAVVIQEAIRRRKKQI